MRSLIVFCPLGLSNRLQVLISGLALAEASGREFKMLWPLTPACAAPFADLFANDWPVQTVDATAVVDLPYVSGWFDRLPDLLVAPENELIIGHPTWLLRIEQYPEHAKLMDRCRTLFADLQPSVSIQNQIEILKRHFIRPTMIGIHLRRGDLLRERPDMAGNTAQAIAAVDDFLVQAPDAGLLLCTDDGAPDPRSGRPTPREGVRKKFIDRYGKRVMTPIPRSMDRASSIAVQDALFELYVLRACDFFVGTAGSSFSQMVVFDQEKPHLFAAGATPVYGWLEKVARYTGLYALLIKLGQRRLGQSLPFPALLRYVKLTSIRWLTRFPFNL